MSPHLILITDSSRFSGETFIDQLTRSLEGGVDAVLVREKALNSARLLALASEIRTVTRSFDARLLIHSQIDVALAVDADGVHLSSADIASMPSVRQWLNDPACSLSVSCHSAAELEQAAALGADFAMLSPVFPTASHPGAPHLGAERFRQLASDAKLPVVALGGIDSDNCRALAGHNMAVISSLWAAADPTGVARALREAAGAV